MRMAGPDIVLFVIGALLFGGATYAIVRAPEGAGGAGSPLGAFNVVYEAQLVEVDQQPVAMRSGTVEFDVNATHILSILVTVECQDPAGAAPVPFSFQATVTGPGGLTADGSGTCGQPLDIEIPVGGLPPSTTAPGATEAEARESLAESENTTGSGTWSVQVSGSRGATPALPVGDPNGTVTLVTELAQPRLTPVQR